MSLTYEEAAQRVRELDKQNQGWDIMAHQEGGSHYKKFPVQPIEIMYMYSTTPAISKVLKYILRYRDKNGVEDLKKARHCIDLAIQLEYGTEDAPESESHLSYL